MRNRIYKYFLLSFLIVAGGIVYFMMLRDNQIVIKSAAAEGREEVTAESGRDLPESEKPLKGDNQKQKDQEKAGNQLNQADLPKLGNQEKVDDRANLSDAYGVRQEEREKGEKQKADIWAGEKKTENQAADGLNGADSAVSLQPESREKEMAENVAKQAKVNINTAGKAELMTLKGIGEKKAELIIRDRQERGAFRTIEDIMRIKGIKRKAFQKIKDQITVAD